MAGVVGPSSLGISNNRFKWLCQFFWQDMPRWTRARTKRFVLDHYMEAETLCRLTGNEPTRKAVLRELLALANQRGSEEAEEHDHR